MIRASGILPLPTNVVALVRGPGFKSRLGPILMFFFAPICPARNFGQVPRICIVLSRRVSGSVLYYDKPRGQRAYFPILVVEVDCVRQWQQQTRNRGLSQKETVLS